VAARFAADGAKVALSEATIEGEALKARATGSFDGSGEVTKIVLDLESDVLDIDRYLPPPAPTDEIAESEDAPTEDAPGDPLAALSDAAIDLSALKQTEARVHVAIKGVKAVGFEVGAIAFDASLEGGVLDAALERLALYDGNVAGTVSVDASGETLGIETALTIDGVDVGALAGAATGGEAPVTGIANGSLKAQARGASPRALVEGLSAKVAFDLGGVDVKDAPAGAISEIAIDLDLPGLERPPNLKGAVVYNQQRVTVEATLDPLRKVLSGSAFAAKVDIRSALVSGGYEGTVQQQPVPGLDGAFAVDIGSVGELLAWVGQPLAASQPDPGPLKVNARFAADGAKVSLSEATVEGEDLNLRAKGSFDGSGEIAKIALDVDSDALDIDRYLPPPATPSDETEAAPAGPREDPLAALPREPFDLVALRQAEADVRVAIKGVKAAGFEIGAIALTAILKEGVLNAELEQLALYGGNVKGKVALDGSGRALDLQAALAVDNLALDRLAAAAGDAEVPFAAVASATVDAQARGANPRALVDALSAKLDLELRGIDLEDAPVGEIGAFKLAAQLPGLAQALKLDGSLIYNQEPVKLGITLGPVRRVLAGGAFEAAARLDSRHVQLAYDGTVTQQPEPGAGGVLDLDIPSVTALAAWLGQPLDEAQPDPGPLKLHADFAAAGTMLTLNELILDGEALAVRAAGSVDGGGEVPRLALDLKTGVLDIDRFLPPPAPAEAAPAEAGTAPADPTAGLPDEPLDLSALSLVEADVTLAVEGVKAAGYEAGPIGLAATLKNGVLDADLQRLGLYGGDIAGTATLDGAGDGVGIAADMRIADVDLGKLAAVAAGDPPPVSGIASGSVIASARGPTASAVAEDLRLKIAAKLTELTIEAAPPEAAISEVAVDIDLPGLTGPPSVTGAVILNRERVTVDASIDPLAKVMAGETFAARVSVSSKQVTAGFEGRVRQQPEPGLDGAVNLDVPSVGELAAWLGQPLDPAQPDPGRLRLDARFAADSTRIELAQANIEGEGLKLRAKGSIDSGGELPRIVLDVDSDVLDLDRYLPPPTQQPEQAPAPPPEEPSGDPLAAIPDEPFDLSPLREGEAEVRLAVKGVKAMGFQVGAIDLEAALKGGVLNAELRQLGLYGGNVAGKVSLDGATEALGIDADITIDGVDVGELTRAATGEEPPVVGIAAGALVAKARGTSPLAVAKALSGKLALTLGGVQVKDTEVGTISEIAVDLDLPGLDRPPSLKGAVVYNQERVSLEATLDPLETVLSGERFSAKAAIASNLVNASYDGAVLQRPVPGLHGALDLEVPSVGKLAAWAGKPLDPEQPDPGPLTVRGRFAADGAKAALEQATIEGKAIKAKAQGVFDRRGEVPSLVARLTIDEADLNAYLPPEEEKPQAGAAPTPAPAGQKGWSREPFDLEPLKSMNANVRVDTGPVRYKNLVVDRSRIAATLNGGVLNVTVEELQLAGGNATAAVTVDASGRELALDYRASAANIEARPVLNAFADSDRLSGKMNFDARGRARGGNQLQVVSTLMGDGRIRFLDGAINGINLAETLRSAGSLGLGDTGGPQKTDFAELGGSFVITNGVIDNRDLRMLAPLVRLAGAGVVPMPPRTVDYGLDAKLVATTEGQGGKDAMTGAPIPIRITGSWDNPSYNVDWARFFSQMDPTDLANLPSNLQKTVEGLGIKLPLPGGDGGLTETLGGAGAAVGGAVGGILKAIPGLGSDEPAPAPAPTTTAPAPAPTQAPPSQEQPVEDTLRQILSPPDQQGQGEEPDIIKGLKGLFGGD
jgi:AsmA protein